MDAFLVSTLAVTLAEIGDKTQLLAILLAGRFRRPVPIILGILVATLANHALAASVGYFVADFLSGEAFRIALGLSFIAMAAWTLVPDKADDDLRVKSATGVFLTTAVAFFLVEMGDKTQVATVALAASYGDILLVTAGTTLGMMIANVPAVVLGEAVTRIAPMRLIRFIAAALFLAMGVWVLWDALF